MTESVFNAIREQYIKTLTETKGNCIISNMPDEIYRSMPGISQSGLSELHKSPAHYIWSKEHPKKDTPAFAFGRAAHSAVLEAATFERKYFCMPCVDGRTKEGKAIKDEVRSKNEGKTELSKEDYDTCYLMQTRVLEHPIAKNMLCQGDTEVSIFATYEGVQLKGRIDFLTEGLMLDYKTCDKGGFFDFQRSVVNYRYHIQQHMYQLMAKIVTGKDFPYVILAQEKDAPHEIALYNLDSEYLIRAKQKFDEDIAVYKQCLETKTWPGYPQEIQTLLAPEFIQYAH